MADGHKRMLNVEATPIERVARAVCSGGCGWRRRCTALGFTIVLSATCTPPVRADVTITETMKVSMGGHSATARRVIAVKGLSMRSEATTADESRTTLYDLETGRIVMANVGKKRADVYDSAKIANEMQQKVPAQAVAVTISATGRTKELLGVLSEEYAFEVKAPIERDRKVKLVLSGSAWMVARGPGVNDYLAFFSAAHKQEIFFGDFTVGNPAALALGRAQTELSRHFAATGAMPYAVDMIISFDGTGMMVSLANKMAKGTRSTTTTAVTTDLVAEDLFAVPAGWKTTKK